MGRQGSPISRSLKEESAVRTYVSKSPMINDVVFELPPNDCMVPEQTKRESQVKSLEQPLIPQQNQKVGKKEEVWKSWPKTLSHHMKQKLRFRSTKTVPPFTQEKYHNLKTISLLARSTKTLSNLVISRKSRKSVMEGSADTTATPRQSHSHYQCTPYQGLCGSASNFFRSNEQTKASINLRSSTASSDSVWFRVRVEGSEDLSSTEKVDQNTPDHLLSSPLCPGHFKHMLGGTGDCIRHGRNRKGEIEREK